jgi:hypothetical protein
MILAAIGKVERVYARKCKLREVDKKEATQFCKENHLNGSVAFSKAFGLYFDASLTEKQNMRENGWLVCYDAGHKLWFRGE